MYELCDEEFLLLECLHSRMVNYFYLKEYNSSKFKLKNCLDRITRKYFPIAGGRGRGGGAVALF